MSLAGPKARPMGVADGRPVDNPEPGAFVERAGTRSKFRSRRWSSVFRGESWGAGKSVPLERMASDEWNLRGKRSRDQGRREKPRGMVRLTVPQTDTGRQVEDTKAFERTLVKELGNPAP